MYICGSKFLLDRILPIDKNGNIAMLYLLAL